MTELSPDKLAFNVLVVDDDADTRRYIVRMIQPIGVNAIEADDGVKALTTIKTQAVDVVISDLVMPKMSGMMLLHSILESGQQIPFIFTTGFADTDSAVQALRLGAFDYLEKPITPDDLRVVLQEALRVSLAQRAFRKVLSEFDSPIHGEANQVSAQLSIMRMRSLRMNRSDEVNLEEVVSAEKINPSLDWSMLVEQFVAESEAQLTFTKNALSAKEELKPSINYVLRVCRSIREVSQTLKLQHVAEFSARLEQSLATAALCADRLQDQDRQTLENGLNQLDKLIGQLQQSQIQRLEVDLDLLNKRLLDTAA